MKAVTNNSRRNQFSTYVDKQIKQERSIMDLSHAHKTTFSQGQLIPFVTLECLPGDSFRLSQQSLFRFAPLLLPLMHRCDITFTYWFCPNRILHENPKDWTDFISMAEDIEAPTIEQYTKPSVFDTQGAGRDYWIVQYMGFPTVLDPLTEVDVPNEQIRILAYPIAAYVKIWDEYYRNPQIMPELFVPLVQGDNTAQYNVIDIPYGGATNNGLTSKLQVRRALWNRDYFTSALPTPQVGEDVLVPITNFNMDYSGTTHDNIGGPFQWKTASPPGGVPDTGAIALSDTGTGPDGHTVDLGQNNIYLDIQTQSATMREFRLAAVLLEFKEKLMRVGLRYAEYIEGIFGVNPEAGVIQRPVFIGSSSGTVVISEVMSTAETTSQTAGTTDGVTSPLGAYAGQALGMTKSKTFEYFCKEHGWIIGLVCIKPTSSYSQGLDRSWLRFAPLDYALKQFAQIGDQAILNKEVNFYWGDSTTGANEETFGYINRYSEYRYKNDIVSGQMRTLWPSYHLGRIFSEDPPTTTIPLNGEFITCNPRVDDVFQMAAAQVHEIFAHIYNEVTVARQLPKYGIPQL